MNRQPDTLRNKAQGFCWTHLAFALAAAGVVAFLCHYASQALLKGKVRRALGAGGTIHTALCAGAEREDFVDAVNNGPKAGTTDVSKHRFASSTEYFMCIVTSGEVNVAFDFFSLTGISNTQAEWHSLAPTNNGWCIVANVDKEYPETAPVLFSNNLRISSMDDLILEKGGWLSPDVMPRDRGAAFGGRDAFVFITKKGKKYGLYGDQLKHHNFTNLFQQVTTNGMRLTNPILRP